MEFNAQQYQPQFGGMGAHPVGMHDFTITDTKAEPTKNNDGGMLVVEMTSPSGKIDVRFNLWNKSAQAVEIANKQLSALCHAIGIFRLTFPPGQNGLPIPEMAARELRGGRGRMEVGFQKGHEPTSEKPQGGYVEVKRVFDVNGNEPGKAPAANAGPALQQVPMQQQPQGGGWVQGAQPQQPMQQPSNQQQPGQQPWGAPGAVQPQQQQPQPAQWAQQPQGNAPSSPPWGQR